MLVDMWFVGRLGTDALAAVSVAGVIMSVVFPFIIGLTVGSNAVVARAHGAGDRKAFTRTVFSMLAFSVALSLVLTALGYLLSEPIVEIFEVEAGVHALTLSYLRILFAGITSTVCLFVVNAILRSTGDALTPFLILVVATMVNFVLDPLLIFGPGRFPAMGVGGAAVASVAARTTGLVIALGVLTWKHMPRPALSASYLSPSTVWKVLTIGVPSSLSLLARHVSGFVITLIVVRFGTAAVATYGVCQRVVFLILMPGFAFAIASAVLTGQSLGGGDPRRAERTTWIAVLAYGVLVVAASAVLSWIPGPIVALFDDTPAVVNLGRAFFAINAPALLALPLGLVLSRSMSGAGYTFWPMVLSLSVLLGLRIPMAWLLSIPLGVEGVFWAVAVPVVVEGLAMLVLFRRGNWKSKKLG
jgi:putative MATE family efflux protein